MGEVEAGWLEAVLKRACYERSVVKVLRVDSTPALAKGDNWTSLVTRLSVSVVLGSGSTETRSFILKRIILGSSVPEESFRGYKLFFNGEYRIYSEVLPQVERVLREHGEQDYRMWPHCVGFLRSSLICFTDLKAEGFRMGDRRVGLDLDHTLLVMLYLGRLHAASAVAVSRGLLDPGTLAPVFSGYGRSSSDRIYDLVCELVREEWSPQWWPVIEKLKALKKNSGKLVYDLSKAKTSGIKVLNHGDLWLNNLMFKYSDNKPTELRFVDFQAVHYNSVGWDLVVLLYTSVRPALREAHLGAVLSRYRDSFAATLRLLRSDLAPPSTADIVADMARLSVVSSTLIITALPFFMAESDEHVVDESLCAEEKERKTKILLRNPKYISVLKTMLNDLSENNN